MKTRHNRLKKMFKEWLVPDVPADMGRIKFVFVLESPHKMELKKKCPAAGTAGKAMAKFILGTNARAFGEIIRDGDTRNKYAIMNVCQIPMQASAYNRSLPSKQRRIVEEMSRLRNPGLKNINHDLHAMILHDFKTRLTRIGRKAVIIPCGKFARKALPEGFNGIHMEIPHPSFGNWYKARYKTAMSSLKSILAHP